MQSTKTKATIAGATFAALLLFLAIATCQRAHDSDVDTGSATSPPKIDPATEGSLGSSEGFLYGRIATVGGGTFEGRLRFGGKEEAFWGDYFNGSKDENPWAAHAPPEQITERRPIEIFGIAIAQRERQIDLSRPFVARFGDIVRVEAGARDIRVTLKSGTVFELDRFAADDLADGVRVWDGRHGVMDLGERQIRSIELLPARLGAAPDRLYGTVRTRDRSFTGFVQWNREQGVGSDELHGHTADGELSLRFADLRAIARDARDTARVTLLDGRQITLFGTRGVSHGNRGIYVDDPRYSRVLVSWEAFERVDFSGASSTGPAYDDFPPGHPLTGTVTTRDGRRLAGRLVYDLDESETTETLDAPSQGVNYTILFGLIASIAAGGDEAPARVTLHSGEVLQLEPSGDLGEGNAGMLIFGDGGERPDYVTWKDVAQVDLDRPPAMYPPLGDR